jgi:hypothetical protein
VLVGKLGRAERELEGLVFADQTNLALEQSIEVGPALGRGVVLLERAVGLEVARVDLGDGLQDADGVLAILEQGLVDLGDLPEQRQPLFALGQVALAAFQQLAQIDPALGVAVEPSERPVGPKCRGSSDRISR